jgi:hypothetical protein
MPRGGMTVKEYLKGVSDRVAERDRPHVLVVRFS